MQMTLILTGSLLFSAGTDNKPPSFIEFDTLVFESASALWYSGSDGWLVSQKSPYSHWHKCNKLKSVYISHCRVTKPMVSYLNGVNSLQELKIGDGGAGAPETSVDVGAYSALSSNSMRELALVAHKDEDSQIEFDFIPNCLGIRELRVSATVRWQGIKSIWRLPKLEIFECNGIIDDRFGTVDALPRADHLRVIDIGHVSHPAPLRQILQALDPKKVETLSFRLPVSVVLESEEIDTIVAMESLSHLALNGFPAERGGELSALKGLRRLVIRFEGGKPDASQLVFLAQMKEMQYLEIRGLGTDMSVLSSLRGHPRLESLVLSREVTVDSELDSLFDRIPRLSSVTVGDDNILRNGNLDGASDFRHH